MRAGGWWRWQRWFLLLSFLSLCASQLSGQASYQAQIRGTVTDATGAVLPNATITITEASTNLSQTTKADKFGAYVLRALRPSTYTVKVEAPGFQAVEEK